LFFIASLFVFLHAVDKCSVGGWAAVTGALGWAWKKPRHCRDDSSGAQQKHSAVSKPTQPRPPHP